jgi:hypothetical protein
LHRERHRGPFHGLAELDLRGELLVGSLPGARPLTSSGPATEELREQIVEISDASDVPDVDPKTTHIFPRRLALRTPERIPTGLWDAIDAAVGVVLLALLVVRQHRVRLLDLLESLLGFGVVGVDVGVVLACQLAVRLLDFGGVRRARHTERLVVVLSHTRLQAEKRP